MSRPKMRFVAIKSSEQQAAQMLLGVRDGLMRLECTPNLRQ